MSTVPNSPLSGFWSESLHYVLHVIPLISLEAFADFFFNYVSYVIKKLAYRHGAVWGSEPTLFFFLLSFHWFSCQLKWVIVNVIPVQIPCFIFLNSFNVNVSYAWHVKQGMPIQIISTGSASFFFLYVNPTKTYNFWVTAVNSKIILLIVWSVLIIWRSFPYILTQYFAMSQTFKDI